MARDNTPHITETTTHDSGNHTGPATLRLLHYNDVYHIEPSSAEPVGGIPRFQTLCNHYRSDAQFPTSAPLLTLFSGDAFNPSLESVSTKGKHMVPVLNAVGTDVACLGNHDLDFGVEQFERLKVGCRFPWLCANVLDLDRGEGEVLGGCERVVMVERGGVKVGIVGVVEREWLDTINTLPPNLKYLSASATVAELAPKLREQGAEIIIVLSHQREPNDNKLATKLPPGTVDIILGGHDHFYGHSIINGTHVLRSGTDFKQLSYIEARRRPDNVKAWDFNITRRDVFSSIPEDPEAVKMVEKTTTALKEKMEKPIGYIAAPLDARFSTVRKKESNMGNFICDLMRFHYHADAALMASGTIRGDQIYPPGVLRVKDIMNCFPFEDPCVVIDIKGKHIVEALENSVRLYPALEGRFLQVSGLTFTFDANKPPDSRCSDVTLGGSPIEAEKEYRVVTRDYMVRGKDGFTSLMLEEDGGPAKSLIGEETGTLISMILRQYFMGLKTMGRWNNTSRHWGGVNKSMSVVHPVREPVKKKEDGKSKIPPGMPESLMDVSSMVGESRSTEDVMQDSDSEEDPAPLPADAEQRERELAIMRKVMRKWWRIAGLQGDARMCAEVGEEFGVHWTRGVAPRLEGRIKVVNGVA